MNSKKALKSKKSSKGDRKNCMQVHFMMACSHFHVSIANLSMFFLDLSEETNFGKTTRLARHHLD